MPMYRNWGIARRAQRRPRASASRPSGRARLSPEGARLPSRCAASPAAPFLPGEKRTRSLGAFFTDPWYKTRLSANRTATSSGTTTTRPKRTYVCARTAASRNATSCPPNVNHRRHNGARRTDRPTRGARIYQPSYETPFPLPSIIGPTTIWASSAPACHAYFTDQQCVLRMNPGGCRLLVFLCGHLRLAQS